MGLRKEYTDFIVKNVPLFQKKILDLGNQIIRDPHNHSGCVTGKEWFGSRGGLHLSMDMNGENGVLVHDLGVPVLGFDGFFDVVINSGFSICVKKHSQCYKNIYNMCVPGGLIVHLLPVIDSEWKANHYVNKAFFEKLYRNGRGEIVVYEEIECKYGLMAMVVIQKKSKRKKA